jgi:16S rRNA processing protein RimM
MADARPSNPALPLEPPPPPPAELLAVGRLVAAQGLRGELRVLPLTDFPERFTCAGWRWLRARGGAPRPVALLQGRPLPGKDLFVLRFAGVEDRAAAEALVNQELLVDAADRPSLEPGEFHWLDLKGLEVRLLPQATPIGRITDLIHAGNDLLEVELADPPGRRVFIPFVAAIVPEVHPAEGWVGLTPPPGLLDL